MICYPWLQEHFKQLVVRYQSGNGHHALLIKTLPGMGIDCLVYAISCFLLCQQPKNYNSCNICLSCRLMNKQIHPDYYTFNLGKDRIMFGVNEACEFSKKIYESSLLGGAKVIWFEDAIKLTDIVTNTLLKIIEEPPEKSWFFLSCYEPSRLLATLRSRCRLYYLNAPDENLSIKWIVDKRVKASPEAITTALRLSSGAPVAALEQLHIKTWSQREQLCSLLKSSLCKGDWLSLIEILNHEQAVQRLHWLGSLFIDAIKIQHGITLIHNIDMYPLINALANRLSYTTMQAIIYDVYNTRKQLLMVLGINYELMLTNLLLRIEYFLQPSAILPNISL